MIKALYSAARKQLKEILRNGGAYDATGSWLDLDDVVPSKEFKKPERSLLAQVNQSYEAVLLLPAVKLAIRNNADFNIALYQFDGISIVAKDKAQN